MSSSIQKLSDYILYNYSKCSLDDSYLASWQGLAYPSHVIQIIGFPFQMLTFWLIMKKTPESMKSIKQPLQIAHFLCSLLDFEFSTLVTPYMFLPSFCFLPLGLLGWLRTPILMQALFMTETLIAMLVSLVYVFECRSRSIQENRIKFHNETSRIIYYLVILILPSLTLLAYFIIPTDQEAAKLQALEMFPCPTKEFFQKDTFVVLSDPNWLSIMLIFVLPAIGILIFGNIIFHVSCCIYYLYLAPGSMASIRTRAIQQRFFIGLFCQTVVPFTVLIAPYTVLAVSIALDRVSQKLNNLAFISFGIHGLVESVCIITFHHSYRIYIQRMFMRTPTIKIVSGQRSSTTAVRL